MKITIDEYQQYLNNPLIDVPFSALIKYDNDTLLKLYNKPIRLQKKEYYTKKISILNKTKSKDLIKDIIVSDYFILGVVLKYYSDYDKLSIRHRKLTNNEKIFVLKNIEELIIDLWNNSIYPIDLHEANIMINKNNLDVKLIDLDDERTIIESDSINQTKLKEECLEEYNKMKKRILKFNYNNANK